MSSLSLTLVSPDPGGSGGQNVGPGIPLALCPASLCISLGAATLTESSCTLRESGERQALAAPAPPMASPAKLLTPVVCPNDRLASASRGNLAQSMWTHLGEGRGKPAQDRHRGHWPGRHRNDPRKFSSQIRHLAPGRVTAQHSASGGVPRNTARRLCLPSRSPFTSEDDNLCILDLLPLLLGSTEILLALKMTLGFGGNPHHRSGQAQDARPRLREPRREQCWSERERSAQEDRRFGRGCVGR